QLGALDRRGRGRGAVRGVVWRRYLRAVGDVADAVRRRDGDRDRWRVAGARTDAVAEVAAGPVARDRAGHVVTDPVRAGRADEGRSGGQRVDDLDCGGVVGAIVVDVDRVGQ